MMTKKLRRQDDEDHKEDHDHQNIIAANNKIPHLPDLAIHQILRFLPTKLAFRASIASKQWAEVWPSVPVLDFDEGIKSFNNNSNKLEFRQRRKFTNFLRRCLKCHEKDTHLDKFRLRMRYYGAKFELDEWLSFAVERNVKVLDVSLVHRKLYSDYCCLPQTLLTAKSITTMNLEYVRIKSNSRTDPIKISLPSLKTMSLKFVQFGFADFSCFISGCPSLESLSMISCFFGFMHHLKVSSLSLKSLEVMYLSCFVVQVEAVNLESFTFVSKYNLIERWNLDECCNLKYINIFGIKLKEFGLCETCQVSGVKGTIHTPSMCSFDFGGFLQSRVISMKAPKLSKSKIVLWDAEQYTFNNRWEHFTAMKGCLENLDCSKKIFLYIHDCDKALIFPEDSRETCISPYAKFCFGWHLE